MRNSYGKSNGDISCYSLVDRGARAEEVERCGSVGSGRAPPTLAKDQKCAGRAFEADRWYGRAEYSVERRKGWGEMSVEEVVRVVWFVERCGMGVRNSIALASL